MTWQLVTEENKMLSEKISFIVIKLSHLINMNLFKSNARQQHKKIIKKFSSA